MKQPARLLHSLSLLAVAALGTALALPAAVSAQTAHALTSKMEWRSVGPYVGGRVVAVAGVPSQPNLFYMGSVDGGIWKSTDYGLHWTNISDKTLPGSSNSIGAIAVAPSDPNVIYAGTGESDIRGDMIPGDGLFKSTDAGKTWQAAGLADTHSTMGIVIDPHNPDVVYVASMGHVFVPGPNRGVFKSTDGGQTWQKVLFVNDSTGVVGLVMDPQNSDVLYASAWQAYRTPFRLMSGGAGSGIYKSTDGGAHWTNISKSQGLPAGPLGKIGVAVAPSDPSVIYAAIQAREGGVFRSNDGGGTWSRVNDEMKLRQRAFYYMAIFVDPKDPNTVYMPQVDGVYTSHDGGKTFRPVRPPHGDNHIIWVNPNDTRIMLEGNDGGATVSTDGGKSWSQEHNQPTGQFYHVNLDDQFPFHIYGAQQDEGSTDGPSASPSGSIPLSEWQRVAYGESTFVVPEPGNPDIAFGSGYFSIFMKSDLSTGELQEVSPWPLYREGASSGELKYRFAWTHPILFSPVNPKELLVGAQYVLKSDDYGVTWQRISPDLSRNDSSTEAPTGGPIDLDQSGAEIYATVSALAVSFKDGNVIWAGSDDGLVHVTQDGGKTWQDVTPPSLPKFTYISCIEPSHEEAGTAYLSAQRYMWDDFKPYVLKTTDYGQHWTAITNGLPADQYTFAIRQDPDDANLLFVGTANTVYMSLDGGANWQPLSLNLPKVQVRDVRIDTRQGDVVVATHGRAFWVLDNLSLLEQLSRQPSATSAGATLFAPQRTWLSHAYGGGGGGFRVPDAGQNPPFGTTVFFDLPSGYNGSTPVTLSFTDAQGTLIRSFKLHMKQGGGRDTAGEATMTPQQRRQRAEERLTAIQAGMNRFQWNLRYPDATEVKGFYPPVAAGGLPDEVEGPVITPGTYKVVLSYGGQETRQSFQVSADPRLHVTPEDLQARLALQLQVHGQLDTLDTTLNRAIDARDALQSAIGRRRPNKKQRQALAALNDEIGNLVQMGIQSSEGSLLHETKLRSFLAYLAADVDNAYAKPTPGEYQVYTQLAQDAKAGEQKLEAAIAQANKLRPVS